MACRLRRPGTVVLVLLALLGAGCTDDDTATDRGQRTEVRGTNQIASALAEELAENRWYLVSVTLDDEVTVVEHGPRLEFGDGVRLWSSEGELTASYDVEGATLRIGSFEAADEPQAGVAGDVSLAEVAELLESASDAVVLGEILTVAVPGGELRFAVDLDGAGGATDDGTTDDGTTDGGNRGEGNSGEGNTGDVDLRGTAWRLVEVVLGPVPLDADEGEVPAVVRFGAGTVDVYDGANTASGTFEGSGNEFGVELTRPSDPVAPPPPGPQQQLIELLPRTESARLDGDVLRLRLDGDVELVFAAAAGGVSG